MVLHFVSRICRSVRIIAGVSVCAYGTINAIGQTFSVDAHIVSAGTSVRSASACFRLTATIAEPVAGYSASADFSLLAGFRSAAPRANDDIFFSGFEGCP